MSEERCIHCGAVIPEGSMICKNCLLAEEDNMNKITYEERVRVYTNALIAYSKNTQMVVALEELSECQKEICKVLRGDGNMDHLAEEIADATIMLEQLRYFLGLNETVCEKMDQKIQRLDARLNVKL